MEMALSLDLDIFVQQQVDIVWQIADLNADHFELIFQLVGYGNWKC